MLGSSARCKVNMQMCYKYDKKFGTKVVKNSEKMALFRSFGRCDMLACCRASVNVNIAADDEVTSGCG